MIDMPPPGFDGLDPARPVTFYRRHLPHWRQQGVTYFLTFRTADSLPRQRIEQLREEREAWETAHPDAREDEWREYCRGVLVKIEKWLDQGHGACVLAQAEPGRIAEGTFRHFQGVRYDLFCMVSMPNHVHLAVRPYEGYELETTIQSWKRYSATRINSHLGRQGVNVWQEEYFDRIIRDTPHLRRVVRYIERNPKGVRGAGQFWLMPEWYEWYYGEGTDTEIRPP